MIKRWARKLLNQSGFEVRRTRAKDDRELYVSLFGRESVEKRRFYNLAAGGHLGFGCGFQHPLWTNVDLDRPWPGGREFDPEKDIAHDFLTLQPLPIESNSAELVHSRFSVEHMHDQAAQLMFDEVQRILKTGGVFRVVSPNVDLDYRAYQRGDLSYFSWRDMFSRKAFYEDLKYSIPLNEATIHQVFLVHFASNVSIIHSDGANRRIDDDELQQIFQTMTFEDALNYCTSLCSIEKQKLYRQNHINWWNQKKYERMLREAGFTNVYSTCPHQSVSPVMRQKIYFDEQWPGVAIYMEAIKS